MRLLLTSDAIKTPELADAFLKLLGKPPSEARVTWIPTAANFEVEKDWLHEDYQSIVATGIGQIDVVDIAATPMEVWLPILEQADVIWFEGGDSGYLMHCIGKSGLEKELPKLLESRVYVGVSAGSMVAGVDRSYRSVVFDDDESFLSDARALGLVDLAIVPHLYSDQFPKVRPANIAKFAETVPYTLYGVTDTSAVMVVDGEVSSIGDGVEIFQGQGRAL